MVSNPQAYTSDERLFLQKQKLIEALEYCRKNKIKHLTVIHDIGDGVLQDMVVEILQTQTS